MTVSFLDDDGIDMVAAAALASSLARRPKIYGFLRPMSCIRALKVPERKERLFRR
jgi:hypothetical protein